VLVTVFNEQMAEDSMALALTLRASNIKTELYPIATNNLGKQLKYASKKGIPYVAILGPEEKENGVVDLKNMANGEQQKISVNECIQALA
jgi:histidyl-tRNA synthetase